MTWAAHVLMLSGFEVFFFRRSQGCRYAPTVGLKLANAFGVIFKLNQSCRSGITSLFSADADRTHAVIFIVGTKRLLRRIFDEYGPSGPG